MAAEMEMPEGCIDFFFQEMELLYKKVLEMETNFDIDLASNISEGSGPEVSQIGIRFCIGNEIFTSVQDDCLREAQNQISFG